MTCDPWQLDMGCYSDWPNFPEAVRLRAQAVAQEVMWALTGRIYGLCEITVRPCRERCNSNMLGSYYPGWPTSGPNWVPVIENGQWFNISCGQCGDKCSCTSMSSVILDYNLGPAQSITSVSIDGVALASTGYQLLDGNELVRTGGKSWPDCQDYTAGNGELGSWVITYKYGYEPSPGLLWATGAFAYELAVDCVGVGECQLPQRVQQISRDGIQITMIDPGEYLAAGGVGIPSIDRIIKDLNPAGLYEPCQVVSPDTPKQRRVIS